MVQYTIKDLEKLSGILAHTIRIWEKRYNIFEPSRTDTNRRRYTDSDLRKIINISILNKNGLKISKIVALSDKEITNRVSDLTRDLNQASAQIESLIIAMIDIDEYVFSNLIGSLIKEKGFEYTFENIVFPFLKRIGVLWQIGSVNTAQEHFISNIIRQKIISSIDLIGIRREEKNKRILMYLPEQELHEIGLLYYNYIARSNNFDVLYLGQLTPFESVVFAESIFNSDIIVTGSFTSLGGFDKEYILNLSKVFSDKKIIITAYPLVYDLEKYPSNVYLVKTSSEFLSEINRD